MNDLSPRILERITNYHTIQFSHKLITKVAVFLFSIIAASNIIGIANADTHKMVINSVTLSQVNSYASGCARAAIIACSKIVKSCKKVENRVINNSPEHMIYLDCETHKLWPTPDRSYPNTIAIIVVVAKDKQIWKQKNLQDIMVRLQGEMLDLNW